MALKAISIVPKILLLNFRFLRPVEEQDVMRRNCNNLQGGKMQIE